MTIEYDTLFQSGENEREMLLQTIEETANMLRGMCFDPRIPNDTKDALRYRITKLDKITYKCS